MATSNASAVRDTPRRADEVPMSELGLPLLAGSLPPGVQTTALAPPAAAPAGPVRATP